MRRAIAIAAIATAFIVALATLTIAGPFATVSADEPPIPGVGSTWTYNVHYECPEEGYVEDWVYDAHMVEANVSPPEACADPPEYPCWWCLAPPAANCFHIALDVHPSDGKPWRIFAGGAPSLQLLSGDFYVNMDDLSEVYTWVDLVYMGLEEGKSEISLHSYAGDQPGYPYIFGETWTYTETLWLWLQLVGCYATADLNWTATVMATGQTVTVPAGTFTDCVEIQYGCDGMLRTVWWSPTVMAAVKQIDQTGWCGTETRELSSYTLVLPPTPTPTPPPPVGGTIIPTDKPGLVMPWIIGVALIVVAGVSLAVWNRRRGVKRASGR